jgi:hypothetical protein
MTEASQKSNQQNLKDLINVTFSQALEDGLTHLHWLIGPGTDKCGPEAAHASHSVSRGKAKELETIDTFGPLFGGLSRNADLQQYLESRLRASMDVNGSLEYVLTWKRWDIDSGPPICALRASARRTYGNDFGGWPTPTSKEKAGGEYKDPEKALKRALGPHANDLRDFAQMAGWPTPTDSMMTEQDMAQAMTAGNSLKRKGYQESKIFSGWQTPSATDGKRGGIGITDGMTGQSLTQMAKMTGWPTPTATDSSKRGSVSPRPGMMGLSETAPLSGKIAESSYVGTEKIDGYRLNPAFSLWLMGYPPELWAYCVVPEMRSIHTLAQSL